MSGVPRALTKSRLASAIDRTRNRARPRTRGRSCCVCVTGLGVLPAALLELLPRPARTRVVAAELASGPHDRLGGCRDLAPAAPFERPRERRLGVVEHGR